MLPAVRALHRHHSVKTAVAAVSRKASVSSTSTSGRRPNHHIVSQPTCPLPLLGGGRRSFHRMTAATIPTVPGVNNATTSGTNTRKNGYATLSDIMSTYTSTSAPPSPLAPSLSHLNPKILPPGYQQVENATYSMFIQPIEQSSNDDREYRLIRLDNGMECLIVSDSKTDKSAAGISVRVGHLSDPENAQGMAHFCEHLLFMGTEKVSFEKRTSSTG